MADVKGIGRRQQFGIGRETTRGTVVAPGYWVPVNELDAQEKKDFALDEQTMGVIEGSVGQTIAKAYSEVSWKAPIGSSHFPLVLYSLLGASTPTGPTDSSYSHAISVLQSASHPTLTLGVDDPLGQQDYRYALGAIDQLDIELELGKFVSYSAKAKAKAGATATLTPAYVAESRFVHKHAVVKFASAIAGLSGASASEIKSLKLTIKNNIEADDVLGNEAPNDYLNKQFEIEGTFEALWADIATYSTPFLAGTYKAMRIQLINTDAVIGAGTTTPKITIDLSRVSFSELTKPTRINELMKQTIKFKAHYSTTDSAMITATCVNGIASY